MRSAEQRTLGEERLLERAGENWWGMVENGKEWWELAGIGWWVGWPGYYPYYGFHRLETAEERGLED